MLWSCFYHLETCQGETPGEIVESMHCLQVMAAEISLGSSVSGKAAGWSEGMVAQHFIPISCCGFPRGNGSLGVDRWEK